MPGLTSAQFELLGAAAMAAPSADNKHVFRLEKRPDGLRMSASADFLQAASSRRVLGLISIGAAAHNLELRARTLGLALAADWHLPAAGDSVLADFKVESALPAIDSTEGAIVSRQTNRRLVFRGPSLSQDLQLLSEEAAAVPGTGLVWLDRPEARKRALRLVRWAETARFRHEPLHRELFESIRFDVGWHRSAPEGLPAGALALAWFERPAFAALRHWRVQRALNLLGTHHFIGWRAADLPCRLAPHLGAITSDGEVEMASVRAGRLLQRVWLRATVLGLSIQVFAACALYALDDSTSIPRSLRRKLAAGWETLSPGHRPYLAFRMGHARPPTVRAGRPSI